MAFPDKKHEKLLDLVHEFCEKLDWHAPHPLEREPAYTHRVLQPQFETFVMSIKEPGLTLRADGDHRPTPVSFDRHDFYPDLGINYFQERVISFECKFISRGHLNSPLSMSIGQATTYCSLGYLSGVILLVSKSGEQVISNEVLTSINNFLQPTSLKVFEIKSS